jgi:hypothetical protein
MVPIQDNLDYILSNLLLEEKVSLLAAEDWWRTVLIRRDGKVFVPQIKVYQFICCNPNKSC